MVKKITNNDLNEAKKGAAVVDFSAVWCGPCQMLAPVMEELSEELSGKAEFYNADSDENMGLAQEYRIVSIPAVIVLKDGVEVARTVGFQPKDAMRSFIEEQLNLKELTVNWHIVWEQPGLQNGVPVEMRIIMPDKYDALKLENQLCFPLYACSKEIVRKYKPFLDELDLTYTQYIAMMVLWEHRQISVKDMGALLYLDSGTLTPVLKKLEQKGYLVRARDSEDERVLNVTITELGEKLKEDAVLVPKKMGCCVCLEKEDADELYRLLHKVLGVLGKE